MIYLDNAATTSPKPAIVAEKLYDAAVHFSGNPGRSGHSLSLKCADKLYECRKNISDFFNFKFPERCIFTYNCTTAINMALKGILMPGDHIIISNIEHNAVTRPINSLVSRGVTVTKAQVVSGDINSTINNFRQSIRKNTRIIFCTHASNVTGDVLPVYELSKLAKEHNILFGMDAAQSAGTLPVDMSELNADFVCIPSHKGLYGAMGCGALLLSDKAKLRVLVEGGTGSNSLFPIQPEEYPERLESGTVNLPGIIAMSAGVDFVRSRGMSEIFNHELDFCMQLEHELQKLKNITIHSCRDKSHRSALTVITSKNTDSETLASKLSDDGFAVRGGLHCAPDAHFAMGTINGGAVRISPSCFTSASIIPLLVNSLKKC